MDLKKLEQSDKTSYYTLGWLLKNLTITFVSSIPAFLWANNKEDSDRLLIASFLVVGIFVVSFMADFIRKITRPEVLISEGALDMLRKKIYWSIGPQFIAILFIYILSFIVYSILFEKSKLFY